MLPESWLHFQSSM